MYLKLIFGLYSFHLFADIDHIVFNIFEHVYFWDDEFSETVGLQRQLFFSLLLYYKNYLVKLLKNCLFDFFSF